MDKRIEKTLDKLSQALLRMCCRMPREDMTVVDLCKEAHINKSTFYLHFKNLDECADAMPAFASQKILDIENEDRLSPESIEEIIENALDFIEKNRETCKEFYQSPHYASITYRFKLSIIHEIADRRNISKTSNHAAYVAIYCLVTGVMDTMFYCAQFNDREKEKWHLQNVFNCFVPLKTLLEIPSPDYISFAEEKN